MDRMDELELTCQTLIDLDEPEALLETLARMAKRKVRSRAIRGDKRTIERWQALAEALDHAAFTLETILNAKPAGPDFRPTQDQVMTSEPAPENAMRASAKRNPADTKDDAQ